MDLPRIRGVMWLALAGAFCLQSGEARPPAPPPRAAARAARQVNPRLPKVNAPKRQRRPLMNPGNAASRLMRMTPEQRERALEKLPPERQNRIRRQLQRFDNLSSDDQAAVLKRYERFSQLSPEKQNLVRRQMQSLNQLPPRRRQAIARELQNMGSLSESERRNLLNSDDFKSKYSPEEQKMIGDLSEYMLPPK